MRPDRAGRFLLAALPAFVAGGSRAMAEAPPPTRIRLMPTWQPQAQFAGFYVASERGFYTKRGLDVEILRGGPGKDPVKALEAGEADYAIFWLTTALFAIDRGVPLSHVAQVFQTSHLEIVAWKDRGIQDIRDLDGRRVSLWGDSLRPAFDAFFRSRQAKPVIVPQHATISLFLHRGVEACSVMEYNERHSIYLAGVDESELVRFPLREHGIDFPEDGIYCLRRTREARPEVARALAEATLEGWKHAADHPEEALDTVMKRAREANLPLSRTHMRWMLRVILRSVFPDPARAQELEVAPGALSRRAYDGAVRWLLDLEAVRGAPTYEELTR